MTQALRFTAELELTGRTAAGFEVPEEVVAQLAGGGHPKVVVAVGGLTFRTSIARMHGRFLLGVTLARRTEVGLEPGREYEIEVSLDTAAREVEVPDDFAAALSANPRAKDFWDSISYSNRSSHVHHVTGAKKAETRRARIEKSVAMLADGRAR